MKSTFTNAFVLALAFGLFLTVGCRKDPDTKPRTELIVKNWQVRQVDYVTQDNTERVYTDPQGTVPNRVNYAPYRLTFTSTDFSRTELDGTATTGTWQFADDQNSITFSTGTPTQVNVTELNENSLRITYTEESPKTGSREVQILLIPVQ